ncbi:HSP20 family protein [Melghiribacillus thermohalophilus]|uniref:HSP20 family protein n=1 Tax=Melghiribacillus thermohalophilus TaxID=1324956 RepID=A0A4R3NAN9_9BACI|nr:Hsp20/alpha crystallin family protein [Melghiribacillus thermohalophilus]TCT26679.1 HSP20 family protein [Melghiribacillus thermohalophilus]
MPLIPYEPFRRLEHMKRELDHFFSNDFPSLTFRDEFKPIFQTPRADVYETEKEVVARCDLPGIENKEDVRIEVDTHSLTISGKISRTREVKEEKFMTQERHEGSFHRTIPLPASVSSEGVKATYKNGVLEVRMPKTGDEQKRKIDIEFH